MPSEYQSEEIWRKAIRAQRNYLRVLESSDNRPYAAKSIAKTLNRIQRITANGLADWQESDDADRT
ncbi:hypothetical protein [Mesorhizobium sp. B4-1-1]|uniref:hypothetical protein n=1 Tax=Mesorhizobium sp. B4-1-1 TaxID=2589890 RepID=UPI00112AB772|nr:hypothetical protein [Mesorhizobium sp. B4-1-1]TPI10266.1 hypothetical protein FJW10_29575 [Mesorhizobium sp. B4-1-1]